jgi:FAD/FMN-containing dehydrogenase
MNTAPLATAGDDCQHPAERLALFARAILNRHGQGALAYAVCAKLLEEHDAYWWCRQPYDGVAAVVEAQADIIAGRVVVPRESAHPVFGRAQE